MRIYLVHANTLIIESPFSYFALNRIQMKVSDLTPNQLPHALAKAMKVKSVPVIDWELCGKLIEKEKISISPSFSRWSAFYTGFGVNDRENEQVGDTAIEAVVKCFIEKKLGSEI